MLNITDVRIHLNDKADTTLKAYASIIIDKCFAIHGIKVILGERGLFVGMPRRKQTKYDKLQDIVHPTNNETRKLLEDKILKAFETSKGSGKSSRKG